MINFTYKDCAGFDHMLLVKTIDGCEIEIGFKGLDADCVYISGHEMNVASDDYKGLYVAFGDRLKPEILPIANVIQQGNAQIEGIVAQNEQEAIEELEMYKELSSPYLTGRI